MSDIKKQVKPQAKRINPELKSQILHEILQPKSHIPKIAKYYDLSSTTLYSWRSNHNKKLISSNYNVNIANRKISGNFVELLPEKELLPSNSSKVNSDKIASSNSDSNSNQSKLSNSDSNSNQSKLSAISCTLDNNISLSLKGNISTSSLIKIINCLEKEGSYEHQENNHNNKGSLC